MYIAGGESRMEITSDFKVSVTSEGDIIFPADVPIPMYVGGEGYTGVSGIVGFDKDDKKVVIGCRIVETENGLEYLPVEDGTR